MILDAINQHLLNDYQQSFPLVSKPFEKLANELGTETQTLIKRVKTLKSSGAISRVGPVFRPNTVGVSTLAAICVPTAEIEAYAQIINGFRQVNHNYEREHEINLWFVLTAADQDELQITIQNIEQQTQKSVLVLPMLKEYHIDLGFNLSQFPRRGHQNHTVLENVHALGADAASLQDFHKLDSTKALIAAIQGGLPLVDAPYQALADQLGSDEQAIIDSITVLIQSGAIKRFGVIVRHHEMGYRANAMVVWDIPDEQVDQLGERLGSEDCVTLCYRRPRVMPQWPYNLFCMIHGQNRDEVLDCIEQLREKFGLENIKQHTLFSGRRFKQRGAHYQKSSTDKPIAEMKPQTIKVEMATQPSLQESVVRATR